MAAKKKKFNWLVQGSMQLLVVGVELYGSWYMQNNSPEAWATLEPMATEIAMSIHGVILAFSGAMIQVKNAARKMEAKKEE